MSSYAFEFGTRDAFGCTALEKDVFRDVLDLTYEDPVIVKRVNGELHGLSALKCMTKGYRHYQIDFSDLKIPIGSTVTLRPTEEHNTLFMTVVEPPERLLKNSRAVVDAVVELQHAVEELREWLDDDQWSSSDEE